MFSDILQKFADRTPAAVMVRGLLEHLLNPEKLDRWFEESRDRQYTRNILFSSLVGLMLQVVCKVQANVYAAYRHAQIAASIIVAVYGKLQGVELTTSRALVRDLANDAKRLIERDGRRTAADPARLSSETVSQGSGAALQQSARKP